MLGGDDFLLSAHVRSFRRWIQKQTESAHVCETNTVRFYVPVRREKIRYDYVQGPRNNFHMQSSNVPFPRFTYRYFVN
jgi:hypothetical protein